MRDGSATTVENTEHHNPKYADQNQGHDRDPNKAVIPNPQAASFGTRTHRNKKIPFLFYFEK